MGVKWEDVSAGISPLTGEIYLGKSKPLPGNEKGGLRMWTDRSDSKTDNIVKVVMDHMLFKCEEGDTDTITFTIPGIVELKCTDLRKKEGKGDEEDG